MSRSTDSLSSIKLYINCSNCAEEFELLAYGEFTFYCPKCHQKYFYTYENGTYIVYI